MTQAQIKRSLSLKSVERSERLAADARATSQVGPTRAPASGESATEDRVFTDGFVFEEAGAAVPAAPEEQSAPESAGSGAGAKEESAPGPEAPSTGRVLSLATPAAAAVEMREEAPSRSLAAAPSALPPVSGPTRGADEKAEQPAETTGPLSDRGAIELRARLNHKEAEILALRGELSTRDRLLLELNEKQLDLERSRLALSEDLEHHIQMLSEAKDKLLAQEAEKEATAKRVADMTVSFRRTEESAKRKHESELDKLRSELAADVAKRAREHATALQQRDRSHVAELERLRTAHAAAQEELQEKHSVAIKSIEAGNSQALARAAAAWAARIRSLEELHEKALAKAAASHAATLEAALSSAASDKARLLAEAESAHRATQSDLTSAISNVQFLERTHASQSARIARQDAKLAELEESLSRATARAEAAEDILATLRRTFSASLNLLNGSSRATEEG